jgi:ABC-type glycerol-3-phosphate transport system permease component
MGLATQPINDLLPDVKSRATSTKRKRRSESRPIWMEEPGPAMKIAKAIALTLIVIAMTFPILYVVSMSFSSAEDAARGGLVLWPKNPSLEAYRLIFNGGVVTRALQISLMLTIFGTLAQMVFTTTMAFGLSRTTVRGTRVVLFIVLGAMIFSPGMIPSFLLVKELGMINTYPSLIVPGLISAWNLIIVRNFFMNIPDELVDAARIDGANDPQIFFHIMLPLSKAVLAVIALFYGVGIWNSFFNAIIYLNDSTMWPIQNVLRQYVLMGTNLASAEGVKAGQAPPPPETLKMAIVVVATVPILIVYPFLQKYFAKGVLTGSIKG